MEADNVCKLVVKQAPREFVAVLLGLAEGEAPEVEIIGEELPARPLRADTLLRLRSRDGSMTLVHVEFQAVFKPDVPWRMLHYFTRLYALYGKEALIRQYVLVLREKGSSSVQEAFTYPPQAESPSTQHRFEVIRLWEVDGRVLSQHEALLPFAVLANWGQRDPLQAVGERVTSELRAAAAESRGRYADLSVQVAILARLKFDQAQVSKYLPRRIMRESPLYQEIYKRGKSRGKAEGEAKGIAKSILRVLAVRFSTELPQQQVLARQLSSVRSQDALLRLLDLATKAQTLAEFEAALDEAAAPSPQAERLASRILPPAQPRPSGSA